MHVAWFFGTGDSAESDNAQMVNVNFVKKFKFHEPGQCMSAQNGTASERDKHETNENVVCTKRRDMYIPGTVYVRSPGHRRSSQQTCRDLCVR
jgi:hypothetical protein